MESSIIDEILGGMPPWTEEANCKGADADICIFDLEKPWVVKAENLKSKSKNTAIENRKLQGKVLKTFLGGELVFDN